MRRVIAVDHQRVVVLQLGRRRAPRLACDVGQLDAAARERARPATGTSSRDCAAPLVLTEEQHPNGLAARGRLDRAERQGHARPQAEGEQGQTHGN